ncbi:hypothetical protein UFOVP1604_36 [uncultured Caudovirales phage]|uniref:Uncharacterized protein n=1 Tax=uncultured Caudovirales phage TaxID=2100421 RepID=A0A6J5ST71_9CAUD|nr:hypothetical protein UFOVP1604_36 [uncultured Caudovirales phage]
MAGLSHLRDVYEKRGKEFLENLLNKTVIINEKNDGAYFGAKRDAKQNNFNFFKKDSKIGYIDRVLSKYYEPGIRHFESIGGNLTSIPENYVFGMDYHPSKEVPLTLSHIKVLDENYQTSKLIHNKTELDKWAGVLGVNPPSIIFQGKLNDEQKVKIQEFIFTSLPMLAEKFKTHSFSKHILSVLNPIVDENAQPNLSDREISEIVFRFFDEEDPIGDSSTLAKIIDPVFYDNAKNLPQEKFQKKSDDYVWIIVTDLMNFIESYRMSDLRSFTISGETADERFISLINHLFIEFIKEYGDKFNDLEIQIPQFLTRPEFDINPELINDPTVIDILSKNPNYKEIYRIFINIFRKKKIKVNSTLFTDAMKTNLIDQIDKLSKVAMGDQLFENYFPSFSEFVGDDKAPGYFETYDVAENEERKVKKVNLLVSDFQPIHKGHLKNAKLLTEKNGLPTLLVCVHPGKFGKMFPFKKETLNNSLSKLAAHDKQNIAGHVMVKDGNIETILKAIKPGFEPLSIAAEPSRIKDLALQLELAKKRSRNLNIKRDTRLIELPVTTVGDSILKSIKDRDFAAFKEASPSPIHSEFYNLNKDLIESLNESVNEQITDAVTEIVSGVTFSTPEPIIQIES